jgi:hypothetical protein
MRKEKDMARAIIEHSARSDSAPGVECIFGSRGTIELRRTRLPESGALAAGLPPEAGRTLYSYGSCEREGTPS